jgi:hypothetical protein
MAAAQAPPAEDSLYTAWKRIVKTAHLGHRMHPSEGYAPDMICTVAVDSPSLHRSQLAWRYQGSGLRVDRHLLRNFDFASTLLPASTLSANHPFTFTASSCLSTRRDGSARTTPADSAASHRAGHPVTVKCAIIRPVFHWRAGQVEALPPSPCGRGRHRGAE